MKKRILLFNGYYEPAKKVGGPVTSAKNIVNNCFNEFDFFIVSYNHDYGDSKIFENINEGWNTVGNANVLYIGDKCLSYSIKRIKDLLFEVKPSLINIAGMLHPEIKWITILLSKAYKIPVLISPRGEVCENVFKHKYILKQLYAKFTILIRLYSECYFHVTSEEEKSGLIRYYKINNKKIIMVPNIPNTKINHKEKVKVPNSLKVVFISRIHSKKNLLFAIKVLNKLKCNTIFDIYGPIESADYWKLCEDEINKKPSNILIKYCGQLEPSDVSSTFSKYDCFLFPTLSENYGHVIAESLLNGCPVVLSKCTTPWDDLDEKAGFVCQLNNENDFINKLDKIASMDNAAFKNFIKTTNEYIVKKLESNAAVEGHISMFKTILDKNV